MDLDLAAFRLNALATLTNGSSSGRSSGSTTDFMTTLLNAQTALISGAGTSSAASGMGSLLGNSTSQLNSVLSQLEASNSAFMKRYNARVEAIGDEAEVLTQLRARMAELGEASDGLGKLDASSSDGDIKAALQDFITRYNAWDSEFDPYFEDGALLDDNQAGEVARFSLRREVGSIFHGAGHGGYALGLTDMGVTFTPDGQLTFDEAAFDSALANNREAGVQTLNNMAKAFGDAAELLSSDGHLLDRRIANAERAVAWAADHQSEVEGEFGAGAVTARLNKALYR
ncbi:flagellar filament capping protein FliD [Azoarcus indigens]|uniref:Flagellar hook-associated protein n=1 Tax=Azoarcus indigens TaxID=29545 RepID=A0A4R6DPA8_9RHOO|nr:flagellar filament capping protein FliD [Azoarcus indigens]NMG66120.1 flagellar filament capping protein FliD [Azoarcus indigens]TDN46048.1 flagellar hook-associated protein [Azoarcus indigens]